MQLAHRRSSRSWLVAPVFVLSAMTAAETPKLLEPYQSIVEMAHAAPPEFAADALLRIVESGKIANRDAKLDLIEQAFRLAAGARFSVRMRSVAGAMIDTRSGFLASAYNLKLDALSLESRAVRDMLLLDKPKARELFQQIPQPALAPLTCDDALLYDVSDFYQTLTSVVQGTFLEKERKKEEHVNFLLEYLAHATSPAQLAPLAKVIKTVNVTPEQRDILRNTFNGILESIQPDGRSHSGTLYDLTREITPDMQASFEKYKQKSPGCKDDGSVIVAATNGETPPPKTGSTPKIERYWQSPEAQRMLEGGKQLRFGAGDKPLADADRATKEWQQQLTDFLSQLGDWTSSQEKSEADYYHQKCVVYQALVELIPPGPQRDKTLEAYVGFISASNLQQESPVEWFFHTQWTLDRVRNTNSGEPGKILDAFQSSGNAVLALYAALERAFATKVPAWANNQ